MEHVKVDDCIQLVFYPWKANSSLVAKLELSHATEIAEEMSVNSI